MAATGVPAREFPDFSVANAGSAETLFLSRTLSKGLGFKPQWPAGTGIRSVSDVPTLGSSSSSEAFHHQSGAAFRYMSDDRSTTMDLSDDSEIDRERQMNSRAFL